jgi:hypothetical protein
MRLIVLRNSSNRKILTPGGGSTRRASGSTRCWTCSSPPTGDRCDPSDRSRNQWPHDRSHGGPSLVADPAGVLAPERVRLEFGVRKIAAAIVEAFDEHGILHEARDAVLAVLRRGARRAATRSRR